MISSFSAKQVATREYVSCVEREEEMIRLRTQVTARKSILVFGPEGVGKSRLLRGFVEGRPQALYVAQTHSPHAFLVSLLIAMRSVVNPEVTPDNPTTLSTVSLKGIVRRFLENHSFLLVLDQLNGPSRAVTGLIKDLHHFGRTPVVFASRSPHMEDIGALQPLCADKSERIEIKNWPRSIALEFAYREAEKTRLSASNLDPAVQMMVEWSNGNPAAILHMLKRAHLPQYRLGDQIKAHVLYLDYRMGRR
ncbi:MAG: hypothetical protein WBG23_01055 [Acidobacteriaceae bacterium]